MKLSIQLITVFFGINSFLNLHAQSITINATNTAQQITMMGADMERSAKNLHFRAVNRDQIIRWAVEDIPMNTFRVRYDKLQELTEGNKNFAEYDAEVAIMQDMLAINPDLKFFATLKSDYGGYNEGNHNNFPTFIYDYANINGVDTGTKSFDTEKYGIFLADYLEYMEDNGVPITYLATAKESLADVTPQRAKETIEKLLSETASRGIAMPLIVDAGSWSLSAGVRLTEGYIDVGANQYVHGYSSHDFGGVNDPNDWTDFVAAAPANKHVYADETNPGNAGFIPIDQEDGAPPLWRYTQKCEIYEAGIEGELMFEIWPRGISEYSAAGYYSKPIFFDGDIPGRRMMSYYVMQKFMTETVDAYYIKPNIASLTDVSTMAFKKDDKIALWVINNSDTNYNNIPINVTNSDFTQGMNISQTYWKESLDITGVEATLQANQNNQFRANISARSMHCFTFDVPELTTGRIVHITKRNATGFAIDGQNNGANGQNVLLWAENENNANQQWLEIDRGNGYYAYQKLGTNYCIDGNAGGANGQNVYLWNCGINNRNQHWLKVDVGNGAFKLVKRNASGFALNGGSGGVNRQNVNLFDATVESENMHWIITPQTTLVQITKSNATGFAIDGQNNGTNGQNILLWSKNQDNANQQWLEIYRGNGYYSYQKQGTNYCIDGDSGGGNGQNVFLWTCATNNQNQHWKKVTVGDGSFQLVKRNATNFALDGGVSGANRQNVYLWSENVNNGNQQWFITPLAGTASSKALQEATAIPSSEVLIYPNPITSATTIGGAANSTISIYNIKGQELLTKEVLTDNELLDLSSLSTGIYYAQVKGIGNVSVIKIIKE